MQVVGVMSHIATSTHSSESTNKASSMYNARITRLNTVKFVIGHRCSQHSELMNYVKFRGKCADKSDFT